jgi:hypothetical protein
MSEDVLSRSILHVNVHVLTTPAFAHELPAYGEGCLLESKVGKCPWCRMPSIVPHAKPHLQAAHAADQMHRQ